MIEFPLAQNWLLIANIIHMFYLTINIFLSNVQSQIAHWKTHIFEHTYICVITQAKVSSILSFFIISIFSRFI
jgi:hypothetical protein